MIAIMSLVGAILMALVAAYEQHRRRPLLEATIRQLRVGQLGEGSSAQNGRRPAVNGSCQRQGTHFGVPVARPDAVHALRHGTGTLVDARSAGMRHEQSSRRPLTLKARTGRAKPGNSNSPNGSLTAMCSVALNTRWVTRI